MAFRLRPLPRDSSHETTYFGAAAAFGNRVDTFVVYPFSSASNPQFVKDAGGVDACDRTPSLTYRSACL